MFSSTHTLVVSPSNELDTALYKTTFTSFKAACATLDANVHYGLMFSSTHTLVVSPSNELDTALY